MRPMPVRTGMPKGRMNGAMKTMQTRKLRLTPNHNLHVITHHGKLMVGRKGRKV